MISIIIRTKNEERWISLCLKAVFSQEYKDFEVVIVDNKSTDKTLSKLQAFDVKVISIDEYLPGKALNAGIRSSKGELICCLSGHCIPVNNKWLSNLARNFADTNVAGVYGRQEPMSFTSDFDKRDLLNIFGLDRKVQIKDSFFHNANSMLRRDVWEKIPFDERITNIEDRIWAREVLSKGYKIIYEPEASVYHYHGIHQDNNLERCSNVVRILESLEIKKYNKPDIKNLNIVALIPIKGEIQYLNKRPLIEYTLERCKQSKFIKSIILSTDNPDIVKVAKKFQAEAPFLRPKDLSSEYTDLERVLQFSLEEIEKVNIYPDILVILEATYPFRKKNLLDAMIEQIVDKGVDTVIPVKREYRSCWVNKQGMITRIDEGFIPRSLKEPIYIGLVGLGCVTYPQFIREGRRLGDKIGVIEITDPYSSIEVRDNEDFEFAGKIIDDWWIKNA